jgi:hypothetical protein
MLLIHHYGYKCVLIGNEEWTIEQFKMQFFSRKSMFLHEVDGSKSGILAGGIGDCAIVFVLRLESGRASWECLIYGNE